jgi:hypothetical protein
MSSVVPHRFLFRYTFSVRHLQPLPKKGKQLLDLPEECIFPDLSELDRAEPFGGIRLAWNESGLGISVTVAGKKHPLVCDVAFPEEADGLQVWLDTRNTQSIHRASRFCHHFCLLPQGGGSKQDQPVAIQLPIARARDDAPIADSAEIPLSVKKTKAGYKLDAWFPSEILNGFDPESNQLIGFYYYLRDSELGEQFLTVDKEFPFASDPSLWSTLELVTSDE